MMKPYNTLRNFIAAAPIAAIFLFFISCSTTTVTTGPSYSYRDKAPVSPMQGRDDEEESFFNSVNEGGAMAGKDDSADKKDCSRPAVAAGSYSPEKASSPEADYAAPKENAGRSRNAEFDAAFGEEPEESSEPEAQKGGGLENTKEASAEAAVTPVGIHMPAIDKDEFDEVGTASWYGRDFNGKTTASGDIYDSKKLTAAHKDMPMGSIALVRNLENGKEVLVRVNDRGPYVSGRVMDLSEYAADVIGYKEKGLTTVGIKIVRRGTGNAKNDGVTAAYYGKNKLKGGPSNSGSRDDYYLSPASNVTESSANVIQDGTLSGFSVQVGVFGDLKNAVGMKKMLTSFGGPVNILKKNGTYVVRVGDYQSRYQAEKMKYDLVSNGYSGFIYDPSQGDY